MSYDAIYEIQLKLSAIREDLQESSTDDTRALSDLLERTIKEMGNLASVVKNLERAVKGLEEDADRLTVGGL